MGVTCLDSVGTIMAQCGDSKWLQLCTKYVFFAKATIYWTCRLISDNRTEPNGATLALSQLVKATTPKTQILQEVKRKRCWHWHHRYRYKYRYWWRELKLRGRMDRFWKEFCWLVPIFRWLQHSTVFDPAPWVNHSPHFQSLDKGQVKVSTGN